MKKTLFATLLAFLAAPVVPLHAQVAATPSTVPDSIVQLTAESQGLALALAVPTAGTFWIVTADGITAPYPFLPASEQGSPAYAIAGNSFLVDASGGLVDAQGLGAATTTEAMEILAGEMENVITQTQTAAANQQMQALDDSGSIDPNDTNNWSTNFVGGNTNFQSLAFTTNDLWLQLLSVSNGAANLVIHPPWTESNGVHDLYYTTNLNAPIA
jgi:hypothetical protein